MRNRIMYIESRGADGRLTFARIARVNLSKRGRTIYFDGKTFAAVGRGEYIERESGETYWFSGPRRDGNDRKGSQPGSFPIEIDEEVRVEYWRDIRGLPDRVGERLTRG